ncbi:class I SAM-dependent methyltransferase [Hufsiella ginkgonis]|nr:class I SAM-dependent methyltransferase [Hufsiella ginkgonis]
MRIIKSLLTRILGLNKPLAVGTKNESTRVDWIRGNLARIPKGARILDAGAGEQQFRKFCGHLTYVSQDFAQYDPKEYNSGLQMAAWDYGKLDIVSDIAAIPEPDHSFDAVMCTEVFEHIVNPREAISEFSRLVKPGGYLLITAPFCSLTHFAPYHYYTGFNRFFYEKELGAKGFDILDIQANGNFFEYVAQEVRRIGHIASLYSKDGLTQKEMIAANVLLTALQRFSDKDTRSFELLNFGLHVFAQKKNDRHEI